MAKIGVIVGSNSKDSINLKYAKALIKLAGDKHQFTIIDIGNLPLHNRDLTETPPAEVTKFKEEAAKQDAYLILTPEYNRSIPAVLKNAIDWGSKPQGTSVWPKPTVIGGTSIGTIGTAAAQQHLRSIMGTLGALVMPSDLYLFFKPDMIDDNGTILMEDTQKFLQKFVDKFNAFYDKQAA
jgi:chromate reductase, NAD(P)H dehydrogenase (quinone)